MGVADKPLAFRAWLGLVSLGGRLQDRAGDDLERETGLPLSWFELLAHLAWHPNGQARMSELADELLLSRGGATRLVARLAEAGLLDRVIPPTDRRATFAVITPDGRAAVERAFPVLLGAVGRDLGGLLDEEELGQLMQLMGKVLREVDPTCAAGYDLDDAPAEPAADVG